MLVKKGTSGYLGSTSSIYLNWNISVFYCQIDIKLTLLKAEWRWLLFRNNHFYVTSGLADMTSLYIQLRISLLIVVGLSHNLVRVVWVVYDTLWSYKICELHQAKRGLMVILNIFVRYISAFDYYEGFIDFALIPLKIKCYSILQKRWSRMLDISNCDVIYYVIYVICSHYVGKAISPLFAWPSSCDIEGHVDLLGQLHG